jgi:ceramide glucosyltransferase
MRVSVRGAAAGVAMGASLASLGYAGFALNRLRAFERRVRERPQPRGRPAVTILKPVAGLEPGLEENLRSFCAQDYPQFEVVLGVLDPGDPALETLRRVAGDFAGRTTVVVGDGVTRFANPKVATLGPMVEHAHNEILVIADSDMRVGPDYLDAVVAPFAESDVGAVTAIYRGEPADDGLASALGAMWITEQFAPSALVATTLEPLTYCFGGTMAVRRDVFEAIGGLAALGNHLADDATLGRLVVEHGRRVALADYVVTNIVSEPSIGALARHELRWARTIRAVRTKSYPGVFLTYPLPLAMLSLALAQKRRGALVVAALAAGLRLAISATAQRALRADRRPPAALIPLRDVLGIAVWAAGLAGDSVRWRHETLEVTGESDIIQR